MNDLKVFNNTEFGDLSILVIDGKEYFPATQCAKILGYAKPADAISKHCKGVFKMETPTTGGVQKVNYIDEGNLYRLIVSSKLPAAERFERWVFDEVLPGIRRTGGYSLDAEKLITQTAAAVVSEVMRQITSVICDGRREKCTAGGVKKKAKKYSYYQPSKMELLPPDIKEQADNMLASGEYSCQQVANFVTNTTGEYISQVAVNKYRHKFFELEDGQMSIF